MLCDILKGWDGVGVGREVQEVGDICISKAIHFDAETKQYCKAIILQTDKQINVKNAIKNIYIYVFLKTQFRRVFWRSTLTPHEEYTIPSLALSLFLLKPEPLKQCIDF